MLGYLKEKVVERVNSWDGRLLIKGSKENLLKFVAQTIPNCAMSVFLLPLDIFKEMDKAMCKFWWRTSTNKSKNIHWMSWERMCQLRKTGGMGFKHLHDYNVALLSKQA